MDPLKLLLAVALSVAPVAAQARPVADPVRRWQPYIAEASNRFGVPGDWIERVMRAESGGLTMLDGTPIRSKAGAIGLMQLMPATWAAMRAAYRLGPDPDDPRDNIIAGTAFLRMMADRFGYPGCFAAYNVGPGRYPAYLAGRSQLPAETIAYLGGITGDRGAARVTPATPPQQLLFVLRHDLETGTQQRADGPAADGLFAIRKGVR